MNNAFIFGPSAQPKTIYETMFQPTPRPPTRLVSSFLFGDDDGTDGDDRGSPHFSGPKGLKIQLPTGGTFKEVLMHCMDTMDPDPKTNNRNHLQHYKAVKKKCIAQVCSDKKFTSEEACQF